MSLTYQSERWPAVEAEIRALVPLQWAEIALDQDEIPLDPDWERYQKADEAGQLHFTTVRDAGRLVGWYINLLTTHPHYKTTLFAFLDIYYILPEYRLPQVGLRLFTEMEEAMRAHGVVEMVSITKFHLNVSPLFDRLHWRKTGIAYTKILR